MDAEYEWLAQLGGDATFELRRARALHSGSVVLVKSARAHPAHSSDVQLLRRECELALQLSSAATLLPRMTPQRGSDPALVMQDPGGATLAQLLVQGRMALPLVLAAAAQLAALLGEVHARGQLHNGIRPGAVLCDPKRTLAWWVDVGAAVSLDDVQQRGPQAPADLSVAHLVYVSPECTGRLEACADQRSDLYAFGVLLYEMLTGAPPFRSSDVLTLIHLHIAGSAPAPAQLRDDIPVTLSNLVMKLLAKAPDERYQSADGLVHDLHRCAREFAAQGRIEAFELGRRDVPRRLVVASRLVGRETELQRLLDAFEAACDAQHEGPGELVLVQGYAGIGKTALIEQLYKPIARRRGRFISGKFDQVARGVPFGALIQAFTGWVHQALAESEAQLALWRSRLEQALGGNAGVLTEVIPELALIVGSQDSPAPLPGAQALNRFQRVMQSFVAALATPQQPLVLFLDDLQWADAATLGLLEPLLGSGVRGLMLLGAYRDNELAAAPRLVQSLEALTRAGVGLRRIELLPLRQSEFQQLIAETLRSEPDYAQPLVSILFAKTGGNPLFAIQFLKSLEREGQFSFDAEHAHWAYRIDAIERAPLADNVVDLMTQRIARLPQRAQYALTIAACIGSRFDLRTLAVASEQTAEATGRDVELALAEGLLLRVAAAREGSDEDEAAPRYGFVHDRVQQSAYALIPAQRRAFVHLTVGRLLRARAAPAQLDADIFDIVQHLNLGRDLIQERAERLDVAALNLEAGQRANAATAHERALELFQCGVALLDPRAWESDPRLSFELHFEAAQSHYLCGDFDAAERQLLELTGHTQSRIDRARIARQRGVQLENQGHFAPALATMRDGLAPFGVSFPDTPAEQERTLELEIANIHRLRGARPIAALIDLPAMTDPEVRVVMGMLTSVWSAAFIVGEATLARLFSATLVRLSLEHGNVEESAYGYVTHAITVGPMRGDYAAAYEFGLLALAVNERLTDKRLRAKIYQQFHAHVNLWCRPFATCIGYARQAHASGLDSGDFLYAAYALGTEPWSAWVATSDLAQFVREYAQNVAPIERLKNRGFADSLRLILNWARALQGLTRSPLSLSDASLDEDAYALEYDSNPFFGTIHAILRLQLCGLLGTPAQAYDAALVARSRVHHLPGTIWPVVERFWHAMALAGVCAELAGSEAAHALQQVREAQAWFEALALHCEQNYRVPALLLQGSVARIEARPRDALASFEAAIEISSRLAQPRVAGAGARAVRTRALGAGAAAARRPAPRRGAAVLCALGGEGKSRRPAARVCASAGHARSRRARRIDIDAGRRAGCGLACAGQRRRPGPEQRIESRPRDRQRGEVRRLAHAPVAPHDRKRRRGAWQPGAGRQHRRSRLPRQRREPRVSGRAARCRLRRFRRRAARRDQLCPAQRPGAGAGGRADHRALFRRPLHRAQRTAFAALRSGVAARNRRGRVLPRTPARRCGVQRAARARAADARRTGRDRARERTLVQRAARADRRARARAGAPCRRAGRSAAPEGRPRGRKHLPAARSDRQRLARPAHAAGGDARLPRIAQDQGRQPWTRRRGAATSTSPCARAHTWRR